MSIFKYILTNQKFKLKDKFYFFGFLFLFLVVLGGLFWIAYKGMVKTTGGGPSFLELAILFGLLSIIFKNIQKFGEKFVLPYEEYRGRKEDVLKSLKRIKSLEERLEVAARFNWNYGIMFLIATIIVILILLILPPKFIFSLPKEIIPIGFVIVIILTFILFWLSFPYYERVYKEVAQKYHREIKPHQLEKQRVIWSIIVFVFLLIFLIYILSDLNL